MLNILKNESIQSFIYRTHTVNGVFDYSNIISANGKWIGFPKILKGTLPLYEPINEAEILRVLRDQGLAKITDKMFNNPFHYREDLKSFFRLETARRGTTSRAKTIKYCLDCIKDQLYEFGMGYFNVTWNYNYHCSEHKSLLCLVDVSNRADALHAITSIFHGKHPKSYVVESSVSDYSYDLHCYYNEKKVDYLAPCLVQIFRQFIKDNRNKFPEYISENIGFSITDASKGTDLVTEPYMMAKIYKLLSSNNADVLVSFWNKSVKKINIGTGVIKRHSIIEELFKDKEAECHRCRHFECFANQLIVRTQKDLGLINRCFETLQNIKYNAYVLDRSINLNDDSYFNNLPLAKKKELNGMGAYWRRFLNSRYSFDPLPSS